METNFSEELLDKILKLQESDVISYATCDGIMSQQVNTFLEQSVNGILYDLNRDKATTIVLARSADSFLGVRWINDLAVAFVIRKLKEELDKYKKLYDECKDTE